MNSIQPLISIVVPSFNQGQFIAATLDSILAQDYHNVEVWVIDGGSTDTTLQVLAKYRDRVGVVSEPDNGQADAINKGIKLCRGSIVTWLNSDDVYPTKRTLSTVRDVFARNPFADLVFGDFLEIDADGRILRLLARPSFSIRKLLRLGYISQPATFFRAQVIEQLPLDPQLTYALDLDLWLRAHSKGFRFVHVAQVLAAERLHGNAKCVRSADAMIAEASAVRTRNGGAPHAPLQRALRKVDQIALLLRRLIATPRLLRLIASPDARAVHLGTAGALGRHLKLARWS